MRPAGFLFEVQAMNYAPFMNDIVNLSVIKYGLGEITSYCPTGTTIGEWEYSFHHLFNGTLDGSGRPHYGGYPTPPATRQEALAVIENYLVNYLMNESSRPWYSFNGHYPYHHYAGEWGFDSLGSEIGENINGYQQSIAFNRGAARQYGVPWFIDVSAWHGAGITDYSTTQPWGVYSGPDNGHSLSLYRRTYFMTYMAGAGALIAEAGGVNFFMEELDGDNCFVPSPLGLVGQVLYNFTLRHPDPGVPYTPFGLLLDFYHGTYFGGVGPMLAFEAFPYTPADYMTWNWLDLFFPGSWDEIDEVGTLVNSPWGDSCDVILQDANASVLSSYPVLIPTGGIAFTSAEADRLVDYVNGGGVLVLNRAYTRQLPAELASGMDATCASSRKVGNGSVIVYGPDFQPDPIGKKIVGDLACVLLPFEVQGDVEYLINRRNSSWVITLINNNGVTKAQHDPPMIDASKEQNVTIRYRLGAVSAITSWISDIATSSIPGSNGTSVVVNLPPGGIEVLEFTSG